MNESLPLHAESAGHPLNRAARTPKRDGVDPTSDAAVESTRSNHQLAFDATSFANPQHNHVSPSLLRNYKSLFPKTSILETMDQDQSPPWAMLFTPSILIPSLQVMTASLQKMLLNTTIATPSQYPSALGNNPRLCIRNFPRRHPPQTAPASTS